MTQVATCLTLNHSLQLEPDVWRFGLDLNRYLVSGQMTIRRYISISNFLKQRCKRGKYLNLQFKAIQTVYLCFTTNSNLKNFLKQNNLTKPTWQCNLKINHIMKEQRFSTVNILNRNPQAYPITTTQPTASLPTNSKTNKDCNFAIGITTLTFETCTIYSY